MNQINDPFCGFEEPDYNSPEYIAYVEELSNRPPEDESRRGTRYVTISVQPVAGPSRELTGYFDEGNSIYHIAGAEENYYHGLIWCWWKPYIEGQIITSTGRVRCDQYVKAIFEGSEYGRPTMSGEFSDSSIKRIQYQNAVGIGWWDWKINLKWIESGELLFGINW